MVCVTEALLAWNNKWQDGGGGGGGGGGGKSGGAKSWAAQKPPPFNLNDKTGAVIGGFIKNGSIGSWAGLNFK